jgi:hypothetical protein
VTANSNEAANKLAMNIVVRVISFDSAKKLTNTRTVMGPTTIAVKTNDAG